MSHDDDEKMTPQLILLSLAVLGFASGFLLGYGFKGWELMVEKESAQIRLQRGEEASKIFKEEL